MLKHKSDSSVFFIIQFSFLEIPREKGRARTLWLCRCLREYDSLRYWLGSLGFLYIHWSWLVCPSRYFNIFIRQVFRNLRSKWVAAFAASGDLLSFGVLSSFLGMVVLVRSSVFPLPCFLVPGCGAGNSFECYLLALYEICLISFAGRHAGFGLSLCRSTVTSIDSLPVIFSEFPRSSWFSPGCFMTSKLSLRV